MQPAENRRWITDRSEKGDLKMGKANNMIKFLNSCHSVFHATKSIEEELKAAGFVKLRETDAWKLENNRYYYVMRNDTSIIAFKVPEMIRVRSLNIVASHSDSPCFKIKPVSNLKDPNYGKLNVEVYGGAILSSWLDRPLSIAGRVIVSEEGRLVSKLVDFDENMAIIPNVAIHQNREANNGYKWNPQVDLIPVVSLENNEQFLVERIAEDLGIAVSDVCSYDLYLYNREQGYIWGRKGELLSAARLDDLACAYASLQAFKHSFSEHSVNIYAVFDNEEVGSMSRQGMASTFLMDTINRIFAAFFFNQSDIATVLANSFMISADNAHALHPNHPELYDSGNQAKLNAGVVIKFNAAQSYVTDAVSQAVIQKLCQNAEAKYQFYANRSDLKGGGTQAAIANVHLSIMSADIGLPQLAMHSAFETAGAEDVDEMIKLLSEFYNSSIMVDGESVTII